VRLLTFNLTNGCYIFAENSNGSRHNGVYLTD
jgi:hypothetical protein